MVKAMILKLEGKLQKKEEVVGRKEGNREVEEETEGRKERQYGCMEGREGRSRNKIQSLLTNYVLTKPRAPDLATATPPSRAAGTPRAVGRGARGRKKEGRGGTDLLEKWILQGSGNKEAGGSP